MILFDAIFWIKQLSIGTFGLISIAAVAFILMVTCIILITILISNYVLSNNKETGVLSMRTNKKWVTILIITILSLLALAFLFVIVLSMWKLLDDAIWNVDNIGAAGKKEEMEKIVTQLKDNIGKISIS